MVIFGSIAVVFGGIPLDQCGNLRRIWSMLAARTFQFKPFYVRNRPIEFQAILP
jgi:hypothetical protein